MRAASLLNSGAGAVVVLAAIDKLLSAPSSVQISAIGGAIALNVVATSFLIRSKTSQRSGGER